MKKHIVSIDLLHDRNHESFILYPTVDCFAAKRMLAPRQMRGSTEENSVRHSYRSSRWMNVAWMISKIRTLFLRSWARAKAHKYTVNMCRGKKRPCPPERVGDGSSDQATISVGEDDDDVTFQVSPVWFAGMCVSKWKLQIQKFTFHHCACSHNLATNSVLKRMLYHVVATSLSPFPTEEAARASR